MSAVVTRVEWIARQQTGEVEHYWAGDFNTADPILETINHGHFDGGSLDAIREMRTDISNPFKGRMLPESYTHDSFIRGKRVIDHIFYSATPSLHLKSVQIMRYDDSEEAPTPVSDHLSVTEKLRTVAVGA